LPVRACACVTELAREQEECRQLRDQLLRQARVFAETKDQLEEDFDTVRSAARQRNADRQRNKARHAPPPLSL
jgi:hypothetical protein